MAGGAVNAAAYLDNLLPDLVASVHKEGARPSCVVAVLIALRPRVECVPHLPMAPTPPVRDAREKQDDDDQDDADQLPMHGQ